MNSPLHSLKNSWPRSILRLSGRPSGPAPEQKSEPPPAALFRRFFATLARLERHQKAPPQHKPQDRA